MRARAFSLRATFAVLVVSGLATRASAQDFECLIEPKTTVSIGTPVEGIIHRVRVERGDVIEKGQVLVELESTVERAAVEIARARAKNEGALRRNETNLKLAERTLARNVELGESGVVSAKDLDEARSQKEVAEAGLREARENKHLAELDLARARAALQLRVIKSPIDGVVMKRHFTAGEFADSRPIMDLAQIDPLHVEVFAPVSLIGQVAVGSKAVVIPESGFDGRRYEATVTVVDPVVDAASGTVGVRLELPNPDRALPAGLRCLVRFPGTQTPIGKGLPRRVPGAD